MKSQPTRNTAASVHQRLVNHARHLERPFNDLLQFYAQERWLSRLSKSRHADKLVLKGALMLLAWDAPLTRPTRDIDFLGRMSNDLEYVRTVISEICSTPIPDDGMVFNPESVTVQPITETANYHGARAKFRARMGNSRIAMQVDIAFNDIITPAPVRIEYPALLEPASLQLHAYNKESVIAEKLETMVRLGELNSRMKDFFDVWLLATGFDFDSATLKHALTQTFAHRQAPLDPDSICFSDDFANSHPRNKQWQAFLERSRLQGEVPSFPEVAGTIRHFLLPLLLAVAAGKEVSGGWTPGGPWNVK